MKDRERMGAGSLAVVFLRLREAVSYRVPMRVRELMMYRTNCPESGYYVCPRCKRTMDREFMAFCDRCGQKLDWDKYEDAEVVYYRR